MSERGGFGRNEPANENSRERMTLEAIEINPWNAVDLPFPADADRTLLEGAAFAAGQCAKAAFAAWRVAEITQPDWAAAYLVRSIGASERSAVARDKLQELAPEAVSKVSPFLDPAQVRTAALVNVLTAMAEEQVAEGGARITAADIDKNRWSITWSELSGADAALLDRVRDTAVSLVREALVNRDERSYAPEEAALGSVGRSRKVHVYRCRPRIGDDGGHQGASRTAGRCSRPRARRPTGG
jgi:hypothetical protein